MSSTAALSDDKRAASLVTASRLGEVNIWIYEHYVSKFVVERDCTTKNRSSKSYPQSSCCQRNPVISNFQASI